MDGFSPHRNRHSPRDIAILPVTRMRKPRWILAAVTLSLWTLYAIAMAAQSHYIQAVVGRSITWGRAFRVEFVDSYLWAILTPLILWAAERFPVDHRGWYQSAPVHL